ncbi:uncharacterized protein BXZ73DRAFT_91683 [Epithele typhae]|uniref:uncharacterized protein n=1 Tax=Epithele typhae TaxID=378194 RepID=UPI0020084B60|nr:uncharacterized protein BXZ73DRAFT_91683 [Epithele typhae]KAH9921989.1 hypothetical protein BXZ73DRAFT_91683 [Epithele typhae]
MAASNVAFGSLSAALAQAIAYLTRPLATRFSPLTVVKLQHALEANLTAHFAPSWNPAEPLRGSGRRCLSLTPSGLPPRTLYNACKAAGVEWSEWIALLGNIEFDLFVDPGCVSIRFGSWGTGRVGKFFTVWSEDTVSKAEQKENVAIKEARLEAELRAQAAARAAPIPVCKPMKTYAQQLLEFDQDDEELFALIADEIREPTWLTPRSSTSSPMSTISSHSRSSSFSSGSGFSFSSVDSASSYTSSSTVSQSSCAASPADERPQVKLSRRERARQARVFVDATKTAVTNYDGGKTTVLTGGVMLGGGAKPKAVPTAAAAPKKASLTGGWRSFAPRA